MTELSAYQFSPLREGPFTLSRGLGDGLAPILLVAPAGDYPAPESLQRLEHEFALRTELDADWAARPVELLRRDVRQMLVLEDHGGEPLERLLGKPMDVAAFLHIAIPLVGALGHVHARGLIHKDVKPANILVDTSSSGVWLTGFGIASRVPREHQTSAPPEVIAGTLAYMAPEQTGRMNRSVDSRSDLYSLGVTFYEMLTGILPFTASDPMEWVHCHIARQPVPPSERVPTLPAQLSAIVLKLLAKTAEDRYQTSVGLTFDLRRCLTDWDASGRVESFALGSRDASDRLLIPEQLYGREREIDTLLSAFDRVVAQGTPELVLVSGYSGIGKSSVVHELHKVLVRPRGLFAFGKFDQYKRDIPYATLAQAFQSLVRPLLGQSEEELGRWRDALREALGPNAQLMVNLVPELELVLGQQPPVPELAPQETRNRFQMVFRRFVAVFARREHPLALFLDDLQWLDAATLDLLEHLTTHPEVRHLLLVGAYRDNEVSPAHPLMQTLEAIRTAGAHVHDVVLAPLGLDDVGRLIAGALHCEPQRALPLAQLVHEKTGGNPFFAIQFFTALADEGSLAFDASALVWQWDIDRIRAKSYADNVVELMAERLTRLSAPTQEALKQLACLGNVAEFATVALVYGETAEAMHAALWEAVRDGLVFRLESAYTFLHDRIQQGAYSLIPEARRAEAHVRIGRALLARMTTDELTEHLFDVANQFIRGAAMVVDRDERAQVATLALRSGRRAKASAAYSSASVYLAAGMALLDEQDWSSQYELTFRLWLEHAECELLSLHFDETEQLIVVLLQRAKSKVDKAAVYHLNVQFHFMKAENQQAVASALTCLRLFGVNLPAHPTWEEVQAEYETLWPVLAERPIESLIDLPLMTDPELQALMQALTDLSLAAYMTDYHLWCLQACRMVKVSMQHGTSGAAALAFGYCGCVLPVFHRYGDAHAFAKLACDLVDKHGFVAYQSKVQYTRGTVAFWAQSTTSAIECMRAGFRAAIETGELAFASYGLYQSVTGLLLRNDPLDAAWRESEMALDFARKARDGDAADIIESQQRFIAMMQGRSSRSFAFNELQLDEAAFEARLAASPRSLLPCWHWILKLKARFLSGDYAGALEAADKAKPLLLATAGMIQLLDYFSYSALTVSALYENASADDRRGWRELLTAHREQLREWAENYPPTFADKHALVSAEIARLEGRTVDAMQLYEEAIRSARENGFVQNEALAHEVAARFYARRGFETFARVYRRNARDGYRRWGAEGKVHQLELLHPELRETPAPAPAAMSGASVAQLDLGAVTKASHAISSEIVLGQLVKTLMTIALEDSGAERGLLILVRDDAPKIEAEARIERKTVSVTLREDAVTTNELPESLLHTVIRTRENVILDDASVENPFSADAYFRQTHARSVLCVPLVKQAMLIGVLYLENTLTSHVFTPERISVLELLSSQAAISLENARLYAELAGENRDRQTAEDALRVSEERWRSLIERAPVGVALVDLDGRYVATNPGLQRMTGYSEAELRGRSALDITHEDDRDATQAKILATAVGRPPNDRFEKRYRHKDGGIIWAEISIFPLPVPGDTPLMAGIVVEITDRKRAEDALRRSEASLHEAQQISHTGSWRWNINTGEVSLSAELGRILGVDPTGPLPSAEEFIAMTHADDRPAFKDNLERSVRERIRFEHEYRLVLADGSIKRLQIVGRPDDSVSGEVEYTGVVMDVTERRRAEEGLRDAQEELARAARLTTMGELAASIAHEINQPLAAIVSSGGAGLRWLNREVPEVAEARDALERVVSNGQRAADVIRGLRALAKKSGPQLTTLDIDDAIHEVLMLTRNEAERQGMVLHTDLAVGDRPVMGDRVQLQQVVLNLVLNAVDAMKAVTDRARELAVSSALTETGVLISVEDSGPGLDPAISQRIFEPFVTTKAEGLGMGLSICRSIIDAHGGRLWVSSGATHGTVFRFTLPIGGAT